VSESLADGCQRRLDGSTSLEFHVRLGDERVRLYYMAYKTI